MPSVLIGYPSPRDEVPRLRRLRVAVLATASLVSLLFAGNSAWRAAGLLSAGESTTGIVCLTCVAQVERRNRKKQASFADHMSVGVFAAGAAFVCAIGAVRSYNAGRSARQQE